jgi:hypothetical protein
MNSTSPRSYSYLLYALSFAGFLFSGYLSGTKFFTKACAFGETCPQFLGYPACYFGFGLFTILFVTSFFVLIKKSAPALQVVLVTSTVGILFAGNFVIQEVAKYIRSGFEWSALGFPTCAYGLIFFILICVVGFKMKQSN